MIRRTDDPAFLNAVANHPDVRPHLGGDGQIDLSELVADPEHYALATEEGGFIYVHLGGFVYEVHSLFLPGSEDTITAARAGLDYMFTATECIEVVTKVPAPNRAALGLVRTCGFDRRFTRPGAWDGHDFTVYGLTLDRWAQVSKACLEAGKAFHDLLEAALGHENHPDDTAHDHAAGAAALMFMAGKTTKAAWSYNKWALIAGYGLISPDSEDRMDIGTALIGRRNGELEVLECR